jgi:hypothetical protein
VDTREQVQPQPTATSTPRPERTQTGRTRILLLANETVGSKDVARRLKDLAGDKPAELFLVAPALTSSPLKLAAGEVDEAIEAAKLRLEHSLHTLREMGFEATGTIGDADPSLALDDGLRQFQAEEVVISTHTPERSKWLEQDVVERARERLNVPVTHLVVDMERGGAVVDAKRAGPFPHDDSATVTVYDLPRLGAREWASILVGIAGTITLGILAIICSGNISEEGMSAGCAIRIGLAIVAFMLTLWHVVALLFFGMTRYRGRASRLAADILLYGIPPAIVLSLIVG